MKFKVGGLADNLHGAARVRNARQLYLDTVVRLLANIGLGNAKLVNTVADGAQGLIEEEIRKHDERFHTVWMPHSLMDHRIVSPAEARRTVNEYMINVMHEEPVDPSLVDFDDSMGW